MDVKHHGRRKFKHNLWQSVAAAGELCFVPIKSRGACSVDWLILSPVLKHSGYSLSQCCLVMPVATVAGEVRLLSVIALQFQSTMIVAVRIKASDVLSSLAKAATKDIFQ